MNLWKRGACNLAMVGLLVLLPLFTPRHMSGEAQGVTTEYTVTAASCSLEDVSTAAADAEAHGGGIVNLPACEATWDDFLQVTGDISFIGQGADQTKLHLNLTISHLIAWNEFVSGEPSGHSSFVRVSGIGFYALDRATIWTGLFRLINVDNYRIDHCRVEGFFHRPIIIIDTPKGLIDNNVFQRSWFGTPGLNTPGVDATGYGFTPDGVTTPADSKPDIPDDVVNGFQVGNVARDRNASLWSGHTAIARLNDAGGDASAVFNLDGSGGPGSVARLYFYLNSAEEDATVDIGVFDQVAANTFSTRSVLEDVPVRQGMNMLTLGQDFTDLDIHSGDYVGIYLDNCSLAIQTAAGGDAAWALAGNHIPSTNQSFGAPSQAAVSLYAELYDDAGFMQQYEQDWDGWYSSEEAKGVRNGVYFDADWQPDDINAHYIEDNTFYWFKGAVGPWAGSLQRIVVRHNHFINSDVIKYYLSIYNPGTNYAIVNDNIFEQTSGQDDGQDKAIVISSSGMVYNNTFRNFSRPGSLGGQSRAYTGGNGYYLTPAVRLNELYIFDNTYENSGGVGDGQDTYDDWRCGSVGGAKAWNWQAEGVSIFFRPPQEGERLYRTGVGRYDFGELEYPHPLRGETVPNVSLVGMPADQAIHLSWTVDGALPVTGTWRIDYYSETVPTIVFHTNIVSTTRAYPLTGLTNCEWYTVTLNAMVDTTPILTETVRVMPTSIFVYLPMTMTEN